MFCHSEGSARRIYTKSTRKRNEIAGWGGHDSTERYFATAQYDEKLLVILSRKAKNLFRQYLTDFCE